MSILDNIEVVDRPGIERLFEIGEETTEIKLNGKKYVCYRDDFNINPDQIGEDSCMLGQKLLYYGEILIELRAAHNAAQQAVKNTFARLYLEFKNGPDKRTEKHLECEVISHPDYRQALLDELEASLAAGRAEVWYRTQGKRADHIQLVGYTKNTELKKGY